jgi:hypothetical protein
MGQSPSTEPHVSFFGLQYFLNYMLDLNLISLEGNFTLYIVFPSLKIVVMCKERKFYWK